MYTFAVKEKQLYTQKEKTRIFQALRNPKAFRNIQFHEAVTKLQQLIEIGIKVQLNSKSFFDQIAGAIQRFKNQIISTH